jgi:hypothetical protein
MTVRPVLVIVCPPKTANGSAKPKMEKIRSVHSLTTWMRRSQVKFFLRAWRRGGHAGEHVYARDAEGTPA